MTYGQLLQIYFSVAHDPTQMNRQGPNVGSQYRSAVFYLDNQQKQVAQAYVQQLRQAGAFKKTIVTQLTPLTRFYEAEGYHQNYLDRHPDSPYIIAYDLPKLMHLQAAFPSRYRP